MVTTVTGPVGATYDAVFAGLTATLVRTGGVVGYAGGAIAPDQKTYTTDGSGVLTMADLKPGKYELTLFAPVNEGTTLTVLREAKGTVLADAGSSITLEAFLDANASPITPSLVQQAVAAAALSQAWAESPTPPDPDDATSRSAKTIAKTLGTLSDVEVVADQISQLTGITDAMTDSLYRIGNVAAVDFTEASDWQRVISTITNPDTRYDVAVVGNDLQVDLRTAAVLNAGARIDSVTRRGGRVYRVQAVFDPDGTAVNSNTGLSLGFDPSTSTGADVLIDNAARGWVWRQGGTITTTDYNSGGGSGAADATYTFTLTSGAVPTFAAGDELMLELMENSAGTAGTLRGFKNGALVFGGTVPAIPAGKLLAVFRGVGGGGEYPSALRATFSRLASSDPVQAPQITNINLGTPAPGLSLLQPGLGRAEALSPVRDANAFLARALPPGFADWLPVRPLIVHGPGHVTMSRTMIDALFASYPALRTGYIAYVETDGDNSTAVVGNPALPFLTLDGALQSSARIIVVGDGPYAPPDYRFTQSAGGVMKLITTRNPGRAIIRTPGANLATQTWTLEGDGVYSTVISAAVGNAAWNAFAPHRVRFTDTLDEWGFPSRLRRYATATNDAAGVTDARAALVAGGTGWVWDGRSAEKKLFVRLGGTNVETNKSRLDGLFLNAAGSDRIFCMGANLALQGFYIEGGYPWATPHDNAGTEVGGRVWVLDSWMINSNFYGAQGDSGSWVIIDNSRIHASDVDGINTDDTRSGANQTAYGLLSGCVITAAGDIETNGTGVSQNRQAVSSHAGYFAAFGCLFSKSWGQEVADTGTGAVNRSWYVGCGSIDPDGRVTQNVGFGGYGDRQMWLDTCVAAVGENPIRLEDGASAKLFNVTLDSDPVVIAPSVAPVAYTPDAP